MFDNSQRWFSPLNAEILDKYVTGTPIIEKPHVKAWSNDIFNGETQLLNEGNITLLKDGCTLSKCDNSCIRKGRFLKDSGLDSFGIIHLKDKEIVGGAEFMPSLIVPYDIPKDENTAFLTCLYHSSEEYDYKSVPLEKLEEYLSLSYKSLLVITDEIGSFPNGSLKWFTDRGYKDLGIISEEPDYCTLHLVKKDILERKEANYA